MAHRRQWRLAVSSCESYTDPVTFWEFTAVGNVARFRRLEKDRQYSEEELKDIGFEKYCSVADGRSERIASFLGRSREEVERWAEEGNWSIRRAEAKKKKRESELSEIANLLSEAGLQDRRQSAIKQLSLCQRIFQLAEIGLNEHGKAGIDPQTLERFAHAVERTQKIQREAFGTLSILP